MPKLGKQTGHVVPCRSDELDVGAGSDLEAVHDVHVGRKVPDSIKPDEAGGGWMSPADFNVYRSGPPMTGNSRSIASSC